MSVSAKKEFLELTIIDLTNLKMAEAEFSPENEKIIKNQVANMVKGLFNDDILQYRTLLNNLDEAHLPICDLLGCYLNDGKDEKILKSYGMKNP